jgi:hypothetical protein
MDTPSRLEHRVKFPLGEWLAISALGLFGIALVSLRRVHATVGWSDQRIFHWPTVSQFAQQLPVPDIVHVRTSTGPAYHLFAATITRVLGLRMEDAQLAMGVLIWSALAAVLLAATKGIPRVCRYCIAVAVFASPYVLESTLWMLTDALALTLSMLALMLLIQLNAKTDTSGFQALNCGILIAIACAVRQTAAWLIVVAAVAIFLSRRKVSAKVALTCLVVILPIATLAALFLAWGGFAPPGMDDIATGPEPLGIPVGFALSAFFAVPLLLPIWDRVSLDPPTLVGCSVSGMLCAVPALIWRSNYQDPDRGGGWLWKAVVRLGGEVSDRSLVLSALAFLGGAAVFMILRVLCADGLNSRSWILGTAISLSIIITVPVHSALQKYREIPFLASFPFLAVAVGGLVIGSAGTWWRSLQSALIIPASVQVLAGLGTVGFPVVQYLIRPTVGA